MYDPSGNQTLMYNVPNLPCELMHLVRPIYCLTVGNIQDSKNDVLAICGWLLMLLNHTCCL